MEYTHREILNALTLISTICNSYPECVNCPFYNEQTRICNVTKDTPESWSLNTTEPTWSAFK